jgi:ATP-dependent RNA helicase DDX31/DBP7
VPGLRPGKEAGAKTKAARKASAGKSGGEKRKAGDDDEGGEVDVAETRRKMVAMAKGMGGAQEFNLG